MENCAKEKALWADTTQRTWKSTFSLFSSRYHLWGVILRTSADDTNYLLVKIWYNRRKKNRIQFSAYNYKVWNEKTNIHVSCLVAGGGVVPPSKSTTLKIINKKHRQIKNPLHFFAHMSSTFKNIEKLYRKKKNLKPFKNLVLWKRGGAVPPHISIF